MRKYDSEGYEPKNFAKKPKHAPNRLGQGMRVINRFTEDEDYYLDLVDEVDIEDVSMYNKEINQDN